VRQTTHKTNQQ